MAWTAPRPTDDFNPLVMKNLKLYVEHHDRLEIVTESLSYPLPKLSTIMETTTTSTSTEQTTSMSSFLEKLHREQLYRKHQFHRFRQMTLQTPTIAFDRTMVSEGEANDENTSLYDIDMTEMNVRRTNVHAVDLSSSNNDVDETTLPLTTQMKQRWDVLLLNHRKKTGQR